jgi:hypothetical protein
MKLNHNLLTKISRNITLSIALGLSLFCPKMILADPSPQILNNGIHFYGKSSTRDQVGSEYLIFTVKNNQVVGLFYMPSSEFNCFYGNISQDKISLSILDPYDNTINPYSIGLENTSPLASQGDNLVKNLGLSGFYPIDNPNENDLQMLNSCLSELTDKI